MRWLALLALAFAGTLLAAPPRLAIIIDDMGYHRLRGEAITALPGPVTCAIIPQTPWGPYLAEKAVAGQKEVMIHLPMETGNRPLDEGGINSTMNRGELVRTVREAFIRIPQARGVNNHMGSILTADEPAMRWLMQELAMNHYFFVDSRTTPDTIAEEVAVQLGLRTAGRDIFLDNERDLRAINEQFNKALARRRGSAIAIGHPYPETVAYLQYVLPLMAQSGVELVPVSALLDEPPLTTAGKRATSAPAKPDA